MNDNPAYDNKMRCHVVTVMSGGLTKPEISHHLFWYRHDAYKFMIDLKKDRPYDLTKIEVSVIL